MTKNKSDQTGEIGNLVTTSGYTMNASPAPYSSEKRERKIFMSFHVGGCIRKIIVMSELLFAVNLFKIFNF